MLPDAPNGWYVGPADDPDRYELLGDGITGGEGIVWRARYRGGLQSPLPLAVKVQHPAADSLPGWPSAQDRSRWRDQTTLMRHMRLDHVVRVNEFTSGPPPHRAGEAERSVTESIIIEMEWVEGKTLSALIRSGHTTRANVAERIRCVGDMCTALAQLHSPTRTAGNPTVHRDVSPANCIVTPGRGLMLIDVTTLQLPRDGMDPSGRHTPAYSAPEVCAMPHNPRQPSADVYAVGALAYFCLTGQDPPPPGMPNTAESMLRSAVGRLALDRRTTNHVLAMMDPDPERRPHDLPAWSRRLQELATPRRSLMVARTLRRPVVTLRRPLVTMPLVLAAIVATAGAALWAGGPDDAATTAQPLKNARPAPVLASKGITRTSFSTSKGSFTSPRPGAEVRDCEYFTGTAHPSPGDTVMLATHSLSEADSTRYMQVVFGFEKPDTLSTWRGAQYFNDQSVGHQTVVELVELPLAVAKKINSADDYLEANRLATQGRVVAAAVVAPVRTVNPDTPCEGPA